MSLPISAPLHKKKRKRKRRTPKPPSKNALGHYVREFVERARMSRPTAYRMMRDGQLRYIVMRGRRIIPTTEYVRLGYVEAAE